MLLQLWCASGQFIVPEDITPAAFAAARKLHREHKKGLKLPPGFTDQDLEALKPPTDDEQLPAPLPQKKASGKRKPRQALASEAAMSRSKQREVGCSDVIISAKAASSQLSSLPLTVEECFVFPQDCALFCRV